MAAWCHTPLPTASAYPLPTPELFPSLEEQWAQVELLVAVLVMGQGSGDHTAPPSTLPAATGTPGPPTHNRTQMKGFLPDLVEPVKKMMTVKVTEMKIQTAPYLWRSWRPSCNPRWWRKAAGQIFCGGAVYQQELRFEVHWVFLNKEGILMPH